MADVSLAKTRGVGRVTGDDRLDVRAGDVGILDRGRGLDLSAEEPVRGRAVGDDLIRHPLGDVGGDREAHADVARLSAGGSAGGGDRHVDPDQATPGIDTRPARSEERRARKEGVSTCKTRWSPYYSKKKT